MNPRWSQFFGSNYVVESNGRNRFRIKFEDGKFLRRNSNGDYLASSDDLQIVLFGSEEAAHNIAQYSYEADHGGEWKEIG